MSGFDKEAERERLREKYEQDQEKRAATQRMSELLLKGATMTNSHCDSCGDPIFRYDGQEFCPTCQAANADDAASAETEPADPPTEDETAATDADETPTDESPAVTADAVTDTTTRHPSPPAVDTRERRPAPTTERGTDSTADARMGELAEDDRTSGGGDAAPSRRDGSSLDDARASLSRTLGRFARAAEETDDPRRAEELLGAAREAAETLSALDDCRF
ncbi:Sjogren's syndrome/scleroderma autoantigen 1 family protein [Haloplanus litoreus]|uniref:Sjogren's syndrome/scleroderma autoantigen 1 family protein n=1 Tax=Haloplanus litoreus TaxID=767515 RepID=A0ABD5ZVA3_9EURY